MKKFILCIAMLLTFVMCFTACKDKQEEESAPQESVVVESESSDVTIEFVQNEVTLTIGQTAKLEVEVSKPNVFVFFEVVDNKIATVSSDGVVTALAEGQTICHAEFGGKQANCLIKVVAPDAEPMLSITLPHQNNKAILYVGDSLNVNAIVKLGDAVLEGAEIEYTVDLEGVVSVSDGVIIANGVGTATITVKATYNGKTEIATMVVEVIELA